MSIPSPPGKWTLISTTIVLILKINYPLFGLGDFWLFWQTQNRGRRPLVFINRKHFGCDASSQGWKMAHTPKLLLVLFLALMMFTTRGIAAGLCRPRKSPSPEYPAPCIPVPASSVSTSTMNKAPYRRSKTPPGRWPKLSQRSSAQHDPRCFLYGFHFIVLCACNFYF